MWYRILFLFIAISPAPWNSIQGQVVAVSEEMSMSKGVDYELLGRFNEHLLMVKLGSEEVDLYAFDNSLYNTWVRPLRFYAKKIFVISALAAKDHFNVFYTDIRKDSIHLLVRKFDAQAKSIDSIHIKSYPKAGNHPRFKITPSENNELVAIHFMKPESQLEVLFFNVKTGELLADHLYDMSEFDFRRDFKTIFLSNLGELYIILDNTHYVSRLVDQMVSLIKSGPSYMVPDVIDYKIPLAKIYNLVYIYDNQNNNLIGAGFYTDKSLNESLGVVKITASSDFNETPRINFIPYSQQLLQDFKTGRKVKSESIPNLVIQDIILRMDGGIILLSEERKEYERSLYQGRRDFYSMRFAIDYYYEDLVLMAINPDGTNHWQKLLQKKQYSFDDDALYSSFFVFKNRSSVRLLYNDEIKNENTVSEYILTGGGQHERRSVLSTNRQDLKLQIRNSLQISPSELVVPSIKRNKLKLVKINYQEA